MGRKYAEYPHPAPTTVARNSVSRGLYLGLGGLCVGLGYVGMLVPGMPSTVFFIVALWAFSKSSPRLENWLLSNRIFGPALRQWRDTRTMSARSKAFALGGVWLGIGTSMVLLSSKPIAVGALGLTAICLTAFLASIRVR